MWEGTGTFLVIFISQIFHGTSSFPDARRYVSMPPIFHLDDFDRCMLYGEEALYCMVAVQLRPENPGKPSKIWEIIKEYSSSSSNYRHDLLRHGLCIPDTFPDVPAASLGNRTLLQDRLVKYYNDKFKYAEIWSEIVNLHCETQESPYPIDTFYIVVGVLLTVYLVFVVFASFYEKSGTSSSENSYRSYISAFSIPKNWRRLVTVKWDNPDVQNLRCIQGIRFYNMFLVVATHTMFANFTGPISNTRYVETINEKPEFPIFANGGYAVQTNFMISTWLLTYNLFVTFENAKEIKLKYIFQAIVNRYIRLVPVLAVVVALYNTWMVRFARGPLWDMFVGDAHRDCRRTWWSNLLFINHYTGDRRMCMPESWYVGIDTQYFIVSLFLLRIIWKNPKKIPIILGSLLAVHVAVIFIMTYQNNWEFCYRATPERLYREALVHSKQWHHNMISVWANIPGFTTGIAFGYIYYKYRTQNFFNTRLKNLFWWVFVWGVGLGIIVIPGTILLSPSYQYNPWHSAIYSSTGRILFTLAIGVTILGMIQGNGELMRKVCEFEPLYILGRLTYSAYLTHVFLLRVMIGNRRSPMYLSDFIMIVDIIWYFGATYGLALILTLLFEMPVSELQRKLMPNANKKIEKFSKETSVKTTDGDG